MSEHRWEDDIKMCVKETTWYSEFDSSGSR